MTDVRTRELALEVPLSGARLIEAGAGTGKTHTLVLLLVRAIVEDGREPDELVAVTYTRAAAGELRERLRAALSAAARRASDSQAPVPPHLALPIDAMIEKALASDPATARSVLARRLRAAEMAVDALWLGTMHGFCQRLLADFGPAFGVRGIDGDIDADDTLYATACADAWRALQAGRADIPALTAVGMVTPELLAKTFKQVIMLPADALVPSIPPDASVVSVLRDTFETAWRNARDAAAGYSRLVDLILDRDTYGISLDRKKGLSDDCLAELDDRLSVFFACPAGSANLDEMLLRLSGTGLATLQYKKHVERGAPLPRHPLPPALDALRLAESALGSAANVALMHRLHADIRMRMERMGFEQGRTRYDDLIARIARALAGPAGDRLKRFARARWRLALIDEFQDTDGEQHALFAELFGDRLVKVGDPKQAIYRFRGGDVYAYHCAQERSDSVDVLGDCYRAEPAVVEAVNALFDPTRVNQPFRESFIKYRSVRCAYDPNRQGWLRRGNRSAAGLRVWVVRPDEASLWSSKEKARECVIVHVGQAIVELLDPASGPHIVFDPAGTEEGRALIPGDIAVLCQTNAECAAVARELRRRRVPASIGVDPQAEAAAGEDMRRLLAVWLTPSDAGRLRALALSGFYGQILHELPEGSEQSPLTPDQLSELAEQARLARRGDIGLALMRAIRAGTAATRHSDESDLRIDAWLKLADRLTQWASDTGSKLNGLYLQLRQWLAGQTTYDAVARQPGASDAVGVMTIHASKGLEFGVIFAPFLWDQRDPNRARRGRICPVVRFHDDHGRLHADIGSEDHAANVQRADDEEKAEAIRKTYVAVTRARHLIHLPVAITKGGWQESPLAHLLPGIDPAADSGPEHILRHLSGHAPGAIELIDAPAGDDTLPADAPVRTEGVVRRLSKPVPDDFRLLSYSRLSRGLADMPGDDEHSERTSLETAVDALDEASWQPRGAAFGTCFHALMEALNPAAPDADTMARLAASHGFGGAREREYLERLIDATWRTSLPGGMRMRDMWPGDRSSEMEFFMPLRDFSAVALGSALGAHDAYRRPPERWPATLAAARGYLRGFIDLIYRADNRYYVLDYKTNNLGSDPALYGSSRLLEAIRDHDYDLQYLIYLVALQRLLRSRLGASYAYERHVGGAVYLFVRGLGTGGGIHYDRPPRTLIDRLESVFAGAVA